MPNTHRESTAACHTSQDLRNIGERMPLPPPPPTPAMLPPTPAPPLPLSFLPWCYPVPIIVGQQHTGLAGHGAPYRFPDGRPYFPSLYPIFQHPAQVYNGGSPAQFQAWGNIHGRVAPHTPIQATTQAQDAPAQVLAQAHASGPTAGDTQHRIIRKTYI